MKALEQRLEQGFFAYGMLLVLGLLTWYGVVHDTAITQINGWLPQDSPLLRNGDLSQISTIWTDFSFNARHNLGSEFLPVRDTDLLIDFKLFGQNWALLHAGNLMWYLVGCCLFLGVCRHLFGAGLPAWIAAALFSVHPLHTENIAWLGGRQHHLSAVFFCSAWWLWLHINGHKNQNIRFQRWSFTGIVVLFTLSVLSSNQALAFPLVLVICSLTFHKEHLKKRWKEWKFWAFISLPLWLVSFRVIHQFRDIENPSVLGPLEGVSLQLQLWSSDFSRVLWPQDLALHYPSPQGGSHLLVATIMLAFVLGLTWRCRNTLPLLTLGFGVSFAGSVPTQVLRSAQNSDMNQHLLLTTMGLAIVVGALLVRESKDTSSNGSPWLHRTGLLLILPLMWQSHQQVQHWRTNLSLWSANASSQPSVLKNIVGQAHAMQTVGQGHIGLSLLNKAEEQHKDQAQFYEGRGTLYFWENNSVSAEADYQRALSLDPDLRVAGENLALLLSQSARLDEAVLVAEHVTQVNPLYAPGFTTLGTLLLKGHRLDEAETALLQADYLAHENADAACNLAAVFQMKTQQDPAANPAAKWWSSLCRQRRGTAPSQ